MKKIISSALAFLLIFNQFPAVSFAETEGQNIELDRLAGYQSVQTLDDLQKKESQPDYRPLVTAADQSDDFDIQKISPLTPVTSRDQDEYFFEDGIAQFSPDYASAVVVRQIQAQDFESLLQLRQEVGIAVISGKIVMFTSGSESEISVIPAAKELLAASSVMIHTHPEGERAEPSLTDFEEAGDKTEYVVSRSGVWAYNKQGLISKEPMSYSDLAKLLDMAYVPGASSKDARDTLNRFIVSIDEYNQNRDAAETLRSADPLTVFPRTPNIGVTKGGSGNTKPVVTYTSYDTFQIQYDVRRPDSYDAIFMSFDDYGTTAKESIDLAVLPNLVMDLTRLDANGVPVANQACTNCLKVELKDKSGRTIAFRFSSYGEIKITDQMIANKIAALRKAGNSNWRFNKSLVQEMVFVFEFTYTRPRSGAVEVKIGNSTLPYTPKVSGLALFNPVTDIGLLTNLAGFPRVGAGTVGAVSGDVDGTFKVSQLDSNSFRVNYSFPDAPDFGFTTISRGGFDSLGVFQGPLLGLGTDLNLAVTGKVGSTIRIELTDINRVKHLVDVILLGTAGATVNQSVEIPLSGALTPGFDPTKIAEIVISGDQAKLGATGFFDVFMPGLYFVPQVTATADALTDLQGKAQALEIEPCTINANPCPAVNQINTVTGFTQTSSNQYSFSYNLNNGSGNNRWAASVVELDQAKDLNVLNSSLVMSATSTTGRFVVEVQDDSSPARIIKLVGVNGKFKLTKAILDAAAATQGVVGFSGLVKRIVFVADHASDTAGTVTVGAANLKFTASTTGTVLPVTNLSSVKPVAVPLEPCGQNISPCTPVAGLLDTVQNFTQTGATQIDFDFNLNNGVSGATDFRRYAGAQILFDEGKRLVIPASGLVFGVTATGATSYKIELIDNQNKKVAFNSSVVNGNILITRQMILDANVAGFDMDHVAAVIFALDQAAQTTGHMTVRSNGFAFTPFVNGTAFNQATLDSFSQLFSLNAFKGTSPTGDNDATISSTTISGNQFDFNYTLPDADDFTGMTFAGGGFDNASLVPNSITITAVGGNLQIAALGAVGALYQLEYSNDLTNWKVGKTNISVNGSNQLIVVDDGTIVTPEGVILPHPFQAGVPPRFYRYSLMSGQLGIYSGQTVNVGNTLTLGLQGPVGKQVRLEIRDITGKQYDVLLNLTGSPQNYAIDLLSSGLDVTKIAMINFVEEQNRSGSSGTIKVFSNGVQFAPSSSPNAAVTAATTTLGLKDAVGFASATPAATSTLTKLSASEYNLAFNVTTNDSYVGSINTFDDFGTVPVETANLSAVTNIDLGLVLSAGTGSVVVELEDINGNKDTITLTGVDTTQRFWRIALSSFDNPALDKTKIRGINTVVLQDNVSNPSATLNVKLGSYAFATSFAPNAAVISATTNLGLKDAVSFVSSSPLGVANLAKVNAAEYNLTFNVLNNDSYVGSINTFDDYGTVTVESANLSALANIDIGLKLSAGAGSVVIEIEDINGMKDSVTLTGVDGVQRFWRIPMSAFDLIGLDKTKIRGINTVVLQDNVSHPAILNVKIGSYSFVPTLLPNTVAPVTSVSNWLGLYSPTAVNGVVTQLSETQYDVAYDVTVPNSFTTGVSSFDDFGTSVKETKNISSASAMSLSLKLSSGTGTIVFEVQDSLGGKSIIKLGNVGTTEQLYGVELADLVGNVDLTKVTSFNLTIVSENVSAKTGTLSVRLGYHAFTPSLAPSAFVTTVTTLAFKDAVSFASGTPSGMANIEKLNGSEYNVALNVTTNDSYAGSINTFDDYGTVAVESANLLALTNLDIGLKLSAGTGSVVIEIEDINGIKDTVTLTGVDTTQRYWRIPMSLFNAPGLAKSNIRGINAVVLQDNVSNPNTTLNMKLGSFPFVPSLAPNAAVTSATSTLGLKDVVGFASGTPAATSTLTKLSASEYNLAFNVTMNDSYVGSIHTFDDFGTVPVESANLSAVANIDLGLALSAGTGAVVVELEDINGNKDTITLTGVDTTQRFWRIALSSFDNPALDKTKIRGINTVVLQDNVSNPTATLNVKLGSYGFVPTIAANPLLTAGDISHFGFADIVGFDQDGAGIAVTSNLVKQSTTLSTLTYGVAPANSFAGVISTFDDYSTLGIESKDLSAAGNLTLGLKLGAGLAGNLKLELVDAAGAKSHVILDSVTDVEKFYRIALSNFAGVDLTRVVSFNIVAENGKISNAGTLAIRLGDFIPRIDANALLTIADISRLAFKDIVGFDQDGAGAAVVGSMSKQSSTVSTLTYNVTPAGSFAGAISTFDDFSTGTKEFIDLSSAGSLTLGLKLGAGQTGDIKLEIEDFTGAKAFVVLTSISDVEKIYRVQLTNFLGVDVTKIVGFNLVLENGKITNTGALQIRLGDFIPTIAPDAALTAADISHLAFKDIVGFDKDGTGVAVKGDLTKQSSSLSTLSYDVSLAASFAGSISTFDDFSTVGKEFKDLSGAGNITLGLKLGAAQTGDIKLELEDSTGAKSFVVLTGITSTEQFYRIQLSNFTGVDLTKITGVNLVVENGKITNIGSLQIRIGDFIPVIAADAALTTADISRLAFKDIVGFDQDGAGVAVVGTIAKQGSTLSSLTYNVTPAGSFAGAISTFDDFSTVAKESLDLSAVGSLTVGLKLGAGQTGNIKLEIEDSTGAKAFVILSSIADIEKIYRVQLTNFLGVDLTKVSSFNLVVENGQITNAGTLQIRLGDFITNVNPNPALTAANISHLSGLFNPIAVNGTVTQLSATEYNIGFNVTTAGSFAAGISPFDDYATVAKEVKNLSGVADIFVGLKLASGTGTIVLEVEDSVGGKSIVKLNGVSTTEQFYGVPVAGLVGNVDLTKVTGINFTVISENVTTKVGTLSVRIGDHAFIQSIAPNAALTAADISHFTFKDIVGFDQDGAGAAVTGTIAKQSTTLSTLTYNITPANSFAGAITTFDDYSTLAKEFVNLAAAGNLTLGLKLGAGQSGNLKLEIEDSTGAKSYVTLTGVTSTEQFYRIAFSNFSGVDLTKVVSFNIVAENGKVSNVGTLAIRVGDFIPTIVADAALTIADISRLAFKDIVGFDQDGVGTAVVGSIAKLGSTLSSLTYNVTPANSFAGSIITFDDFSTVGKEFKDLTAAGSLTLGLKLATGQTGDIKLELEDSTGAKSFVVLSNITDVENIYRIQLSSFLGIDLTKVVSFNLVLENGKITNTGALQIRLGDFIPTIAPDAALTAADISHLAFKDIVGFDKDGTGVTVKGDITKQSSSLSTLSYDVSLAASFAGSISTFDDFSTVGKEFKDLSTTGSITLGLKLGAAQTGDIKLELEDSTGAKSFVVLTGITSTEQFYRVQLSNFTGVDLTKITGVNLVVENGKITNIGSLQIRIGDFIPVIAADAALTIADISRLAFKDIVGFDQDGAGTAVKGDVSKQSSSLSTLTYDVTPANSFAGAISAFDDFSTVGKESKDLTSAGSITLGLKLNAGSGDLKLELEDINGAKSFVVLTGITSTEKFYRAQLSNFLGIDLTKIVGINLVVENGKISSTGALQIRLGDFISTVAPTAGLTAADVSHFSGLFHLVTFGNNLPFSPVGNSGLTVTSPSLYSMAYDLTPAGSYMGSISSFDDFSRLPVESKNFSVVSNIVLGLRLAAGTGKIKLELEDTAGAKSFVTLDGVDTTERFYSVSLGLFTGIDLTKIRTINVVLEAANVSQEQSTLHVRFGDQLSKVTFADPSLTAANISHLGFNDIVAFDSDGTGSAVTASLSKQSSTLSNLTYSLNGPNPPFAGAIATFDDYTTPGKETKDLSGTSDITLGFKLLSAAGQSGDIKLELEDSTGAKASVTLRDINNAQEKFYRVALSSFAGVDLTRIVSFNIVLEGGKISGNSTLQVRVGDFIPTINADATLTTADVSRFAFKDIVGFDQDGAGTAVIGALSKQSSTLSSLAYNVTPAGSFAGSIVTFDDFSTVGKEFKDLTSAGSLTLGLKLATGQTGDIKLELEDSTGAKSFVVLSNITDVEKIYRIQLSSFLGIDLTKVVSFNLVLENGKITNTGALQIRLGDFIPTIAPDAALTAADISHLAFKDIVGFDKDGTGVTVKGDITKQSSSLSTLSYDVSLAASFAGSISTFDDFSTVGKEFKDLSGAGNITLGLKLGAAQIGDIKLELEDSTGAKSFVVLTGITSTEQFYRVQLSNFTGVDLTKITGVNLVVENGKITNIGTLAIRLGDFIPTIVADAALTTADISRFAFKDIVGFDQDGAGTAVVGALSKQSSTLSSLAYNVTPAGSFAGSIVTFDDFSTVGKEFKDLTTAGSLTLGLKLATGQTGDIKLELEDSTGAKTFVILSNITDVEKIYRIQLSSFLGIDLTKVVSFNLVLENGKITNAGALQIRLGDFIPTIAPDAALTAADISHLAFKDIVGFDKDGTGVAVKGDLTKQSSSLSTLSYDVNLAASFAGSISTFDDFSTVGKEFKDLSGAGNITLGLKLGATQTGDIKLELEDSTGAKSFVVLTGITSTEQFYRVQLSNFTGVDLTKITGVNLVVENGKITNIGTLAIRLGDFIPTIVADAALTAADISRLAFKDIVGFDQDGAGVAVVGTIAKQGSTLSSLTYNVTPANSFAGSIITFDDFSTVGKEFKDLTTAGSLTLGLKLATGQTGDIKLELEDSTGAKTFVILSNITDVEKIYRIQLSSFLGIDLTKVVSFNLVLENGKITNTGALQIRLGDFIPTIAPDATLTAADISHLAFKDIVGFDKDGAATAVKGDITKQSSSLSTLRYDVSLAASFAGSISTFDDFSTVGKEFKDLSGAGNITLGLKLGVAQTGDIKLELEDSTGAKSFVVLTGITSTEQFYRVQLSNFTGVDLTKITGVNLVVENGEITNIGTLAIRLGDFIPTIVADAALTTADISRLAFKDIVGFDQDGAGVAVVGTIAKQGSTLSSLTYNVTPAGSFAGAISTFDDFSTVAKESADLSAAGSLTVGLKLGAGQTGNIKLEIEDSTGAKAFVILSSITDIEKIYRVQLTNFLGVDLTKVTSFNLVLENGSITNAGTLQIRLGDFITNVNPNPALTVVNISHLSGLFSPIAVNGTATQLSATEYNIGFNVTTAGSFTAGISPFDDYSTVAKEVKNLSGVADIFVGLKLAAGTGTIVFEVGDSLGGKSIVKLNGVSTTEQFYGIPVASLVGNVDLTKVTGINFTVISENVTTKVGTLSVRLGDHAFVPTLSPDPTLSALDYTHFSGIKQAVAFDSDGPTLDDVRGVVLFQTAQSTLFLYDFTKASGFAGMIYGFDDYGTAPVETQDISALTDIVLSFHLTEGTGTITFEILDDLGNKNIVYLSGLNALETYYRIPLSLLDKVNLTRVQSINIVIESKNFSDLDTAVSIKLGDVPIVNPNPALTAANISHLTGLFNPVAVNGTATQLGVTQYNVGYDVSVADSFTVGISPFDDYSTVAKEIKNLSAVASITAGLKLAAGTGSVVFEVEDSLGGKSIITLGGLTTTEQFYAITLANLVGNVDLTKVTNVNFTVVESKVTTKVGTLSVRLGDHAFTPSIAPNAALTAADISHRAFKDIVGFDQDGAGVAVTGTVAKQSTTLSALTYNITPANSFAGAITTFDDYSTVAKEFMNLAVAGDLTLGLKLGAGQSGNLKLEIEDSTGAKSFVTLTGVTSTEQFYRIALSNFTGVDLTKITSFNVVLENGKISNTGTLAIRLGDFISTVNADPVLTVADISRLAFKDIVGFDQDGAGAAVVGTINKQGSTLSSLTYDVTPAGSFAGAISTFDDFSTVAKEFADLSAAGSLTFGLKLGAGQTGDIKLEIEDSTGAKAFVILSSLTDVEKIYRVQLSSFLGVDLTKVTGFNLVLENGKITNAGTLQIRLGDFITNVNPNPALTAANISHLSGLYNPIAVNGAATQSSATEYNVSFNVTTAGSFTAGISPFDDYATVAKEVKNLSGVADIFVGLKLASGTGTIVLEVEDSVGGKSIVKLNGVSTTEQFYGVPVAGLVGNVDLTKVTGINFTVISENVTTKVGTLSVRIGDHAFIPSIGPDATLTSADISHFTFKDIVGFDQDGAGAAVTGTIAKQSTTLSTLTYNITPANSFAGAITTFDDYSTLAKEFVNLAAAGNLTLGLKLGAGQSGNLKLEIEDSTGAKSYVTLTGVTSTEQFYRIALSNFTGVDLTKVVSFNIVAENGKVSNVGTLAIRVGDFIPTIVADAALTIADISRLAFKDIIGFDFDGAGVVTKQSSTVSSLVYTAANPGSFAGAISTFDDFSTGTKEFINLSTAGSLTLGLKLGAGQTGDLKLEIEDAAGAKAFVILSSVTDVEKFYRIQLVDFLGVDLTKIVGFNLVAENGKITSAGTLQIRLGDFTPTVAPNAALTAADISRFAFKDIIGFDFDGAGVVTKQSSTVSTLAYTAANAGSFAGAISTFDDYSTVAEEFANLTGAGNLTLGLKLGVGQSGNVKLEIEDSTGAKSHVILTGVTSTEQFYRIVLSSFTGVDLTKVTSFNVVLENGKISNTGTLQIRLGNFPLLGAHLAAVSVYNATNLTQLASTPELTAGGGNTAVGSPNGTALASALSSSELEYEYNLQGSSTAFAFSRIANADNSVFTLPQQVILAARGSLDALTRVEIKDENGNAVSYYLQLGVAYQNFTLDLSLAPAAFDRTKVKEIVFVQDANFKSGLPNDLVQIQIKGIDYTSPVLSTAQTQLKSNLIDQGLDYFVTGVGIDPATHLPYDRVGVKVTQPTLIGFYLQILAESIKGNLNNGMTTAQALTEINFVMDQVLSLQQNYGWKGLLAWMNLDPISAASTQFNFIDNGNLTMSLAVLAGSLESVSLAGADATVAAQIITKVNTVIQNQKVGYVDLANQAFGLFAQGYNTATNSYDAWVNRVAVEFRPAIALLKTLYGSDIPDTAWSKILPNSGHEFFYNPTYVDRNGKGIANMGSWDGGAFQLFWPQLFVRESDFIGTRNALYNGLLSYLDYSNRNKIPGIVSASDVPGEGYVGAQGVGILAESPIHQASGLLMDTGSIYALASAYSIDPALVMSWLEAIGSQLDIEGIYGFFDAARSNSQVVQNYIGIDLASTILGLAGTGPDAFKTYLRNRDLEHNFNTLYDNLSRAMVPLIPKTDAVAAQAPEFADKSLSVFSDFVFEGALNNFQPAVNTLFSTAQYFQGYKFNYGNLNGVGGWGGHDWVLSQNYNASANELVIYAGVIDSPQQIRIELKNQADVTVYSTNVNLPVGPFQTIRIQLPNEAALQGVRSVFAIVDQNHTGDLSGEFTIYAMNFIHLASIQNLIPDPTLGSGDVTALPAGGTPNLVSSNGGSTLSTPAPNYYKIAFNLNQDSFAGASVNFDPLNNGSTVDLSGFSQIIFGVQSAKAHTLKLEFEDIAGRKSTQYVTNVNVSENYYRFLKNFLAGGVDISRIKNINVIVDGSSVQPGDETGDFSIQIKSL